MSGSSNEPAKGGLGTHGTARADNGHDRINMEWAFADAIHRIPAQIWMTLAYPLKGAMKEEIIVGCRNICGG